MKPSNFPSSRGRCGAVRTPGESGDSLPNLFSLRSLASGGRRLPRAYPSARRETGKGRRGEGTEPGPGGRIPSAHREAAVSDPSARRAMSSLCPCSRAPCSTPNRRGNPLRPSGGSPTRHPAEPASGRALSGARALQGRPFAAFGPGAGMFSLFRGLLAPALSPTALPLPRPRFDTRWKFTKTAKSFRFPRGRFLPPAGSGRSGPLGRTDDSMPRATKVPVSKAVRLLRSPSSTGQTY